MAYQKYLALAPVSPERAKVEEHVARLTSAPAGNTATTSATGKAEEVP